MKDLIFFQAANFTDAEVKQQFVVRRKEFELVMSEIRRSDMKGSIQHYIFIGQRGSGKSTLLRRIQAEINTEKELSDRLIAVNLSEEQAGIYRLHDLWDRVNDELRMRGLEVKETDWAQYDDLTAYAKALYATMQSALAKAGKKLVLMIDNIDRVLENIKTDDNHLFRELLMNYKDVRIIGGSTRLSEHHWKYDQPFYEFFQMIRLQPLTERELEELLVFWSDTLNQPSIKEFIKKNPGKLNAIRILSDGMPRTMLHLVDLLINKPEDKGYEYLRKIIDRATPIYQERLGLLSPQQQKVLLELAFFWDAASIKQLTETAKMESKLLSAALKPLVDAQIVDKIPGKGKNHYYILKERFFNLWLIMTQGGPKQKAKVKYMTVFLETWYDAEELKQLYGRFKSDIATGCLTHDHAILMGKALVHSKVLKVEERDGLIDDMERIAANNKDYLDLLPPKTLAIYKKAQTLTQKEKYDDAINLINEIEQFDTVKELILGMLFVAKGDMSSAKLHLKSSSEAGNENATYNLAIIYKEEGKVNVAEKFYHKAIAKGLAEAMYGLAILYQSQGKISEAKEYYNMAIDKGHLNAMGRLCMLYYQNNEEPQKALQLMNKAFSIRKDSSFEKQFIETVINVWAGNFETLNTVPNLLIKALNSDASEKLEGFLTVLLTHCQTNSVFEWFNHPEFGEKLKDMLKPLYFVTERLINDKAAQEVLLTMPPELKETVDTIYNEIRERQEFYFGR